MPGNGLHDRTLSARQLASSFLELSSKSFLHDCRQRDTLSSQQCERALRALSVVVEDGADGADGGSEARECQLRQETRLWWIWDRVWWGSPMEPFRAEWVHPHSFEGAKLPALRGMAPSAARARRLPSLTGAACHPPIKAMRAAVP